MGPARYLIAVGALVVLVAALVLPGAAQAPSNRTMQWKMQSSWPAADFHQVNPKGLVEKIAEMSGGRLKIELHPAGAVVSSFEVLDAVNRGLLDAGHSWPGFWTGKHPAATLFGSAPGGPYGMNAEDYLGWIYLGGGLELYNELIQKELKSNVVVFPTFGETPEPQGWFRKPIKSIADLKGVKFRATGLSAEVFREMGMTVVSVAPGEIVPALERGVVDAAEFSDPSADMAIGLHHVRKFYHMPGIHQPTGIMEMQINKGRWDELPDDLKAIIKYAAMAEALHYTVKMLDRNSQDLLTLVTKQGVTVVETPKDVMNEILKAWDRVAERKVKENPFFAKVLESQKTWAQRVVPYRRCCHPPYELAADYYWKGVNPFKILKP
ncbi:MAG TPA: TRAP transporter substrate-binding protein [Candidatus Tectomicrobia bacterium]|nr:TRAP transporter substrate-binding protein [Candidatus Tectomicrobia bacterium]